MTAKDINGNEIKVGDTVERVVYSCQVKLGESYLVESISNASYVPYLRLEGIVGSYYANKFKVIKKQPFTKSDLKDGMVVTYREGEERLLFKGTLFDSSKCSVLYRGSVLSGFNDDLSYKTESSMDIVKVTYMEEVLWEREEAPTQEQLRIKELEEEITKMQEELNKLL